MQMYMIKMSTDSHDTFIKNWINFFLKKNTLTVIAHIHTSYTAKIEENV